MAKTINFKNCSVPGQYAINMKERHKFNFVDAHSDGIFRAIFTGVADVLKNHRSKNKEKICLVIKDDKGTFKFGATLTYRKPEEGDEDDSGNWFLEFTFDPDDLVGIEEVIEVPSAEFTFAMNEECYNIASVRFVKNQYLYDALNTAFDTIMEFLDANATEGEEVELILDGVFTASVVVEDGVKIFSITPGEKIKQIIKADDIL